ncbi:hypothetical protein B8A44_07115 [Dolosigranulum pigrum]|uniref:Uncharacterized protein n=1 Tax=Dolosigranulum pigrum TaxID=29394 RepID=A0A1S8KPG9_9LACT|nr:hypothetical protein [Dolosigranulum pigrum]OOL81639.1 hypothetical protein BWX42_07995 [Dolosigranulum pigrum]QJS95679.1 hypothetical protein B5772_01385 [Dolosigranulum pigrum]RAN52521.1 hypothetical protein B8A39_05030 [Dolosigranulum pigrum]RAN62763.1 hypothetical protein B8A44_07115 [Dolosigranulum pigrum]
MSQKKKRPPIYWAVVGLILSGAFLRVAPLDKWFSEKVSIIILSGFILFCLSLYAGFWFFRKYKD